MGGCQADGIRVALGGAHARGRVRVQDVAALGVGGADLVQGLIVARGEGVKIGPDLGMMQGTHRQATGLGHAFKQIKHRRRVLAAPKDNSRPASKSSRHPCGDL